jgi:hypothetical protein
MTHSSFIRYIIVIIGTATHIRIPSSQPLMDSTHHHTCPNSDDFSPTSRWEMVLVKVVHTILPIISTEYVE